MPKRYRVRPFLDQSYYNAIGRAVVTWAALEIQLDEAIMAMLKQKSARPIIKEFQLTRVDNLPNGLKDRLKLAGRLANVRYSGALLERILRIIKSMRTLSKDRHRLAHGAWVRKAIPNNQLILFSEMRRYGTPRKERIYTVPQIRRTTHEICDVYADLFNFMIQHHPGGSLSKRMRELVPIPRGQQRTAARPSTRGKPS